MNELYGASREDSSKQCADAGLYTARSSVCVFAGARRQSSRNASRRPSLQQAVCLQVHLYDVTLHRSGKIRSNGVGHKLHRQRIPRLHRMLSIASVASSDGQSLYLCGQLHHLLLREAQDSVEQVLAHSLVCSIDLNTFPCRGPKRVLQLAPV